MSPLLALHVTRVTCRDSIRRHGLIPASPGRGRPFGVYVTADGVRNRNTIQSSTLEPKPQPAWSNNGYGSDIWQIAYIGPLAPDPYFQDALILFDPIPANHVTLVTRNGK